MKWEFMYVEIFNYELAKPLCLIISKNQKYLHRKHFSYVNSIVNLDDRIIKLDDQFERLFIFRFCV